MASGHCLACRERRRAPGGWDTPAPSLWNGRAQVAEPEEEELDDEVDGVPGEELPEDEPFGAEPFGAFCGRMTISLAS